MSVIEENKKMHQAALWLATNCADAIQLEAHARACEEISQELLRESRKFADRAKQYRNEAQEKTDGKELLEYMVKRDSDGPAN